MSEGWRIISAIFERALEEPPERLDSFLAEACGGDASLEAEVRSLLRHHGEAGTFLQPGAALLAPLEREPSTGALREGQTLGAWRLLRSLGEGGMGVVWLAERADGQFVQRGALKVIRHGLASEEMVRRFRRERQILAALDHPNIARLLDGGSTPEGLPYLVMEFIDGQPLYAYCSDRTPAVADRLQLFLALCGAVQYAHQKLVLHRDLKPGNVLVTPEGTSRLLDFGVGKIFDPETQAEAADLRTVNLPLTRQYASPEQLRGEEITTASDLYSLGVLLYELLTGMHPYSTSGGSTSELIRTVLETDPPRPSTAVTLPHPSVAPGVATARLPARPREAAATLKRRLSGDLDNIVLKAIAKVPSRRYASVEQLASDVRRYMGGHPVLARPDAWSYRAGKFVQRNRVAVTLGSLALAALVAGLAVSLLQASVARHERSLAVQRLREVQSLANTLMFDVYDGIENMPGATAVRTKVIEKAARYLEGLSQQVGRDSSLRFSLADAYERLGTAQRQVWRGDASRSAEAFLSYDKSRALREGLLRDYPDNERALAGLIMTCTRIGALDETRNRFSEALDLMRRAALNNQRLVTLHPENASYSAGIPKRHNNLGNALVYNHRPDDAAVELRQAMEGFAALAARDTADWEQRRLLAMSTTVYGQCLLARPGATDSALNAERGALEIYSGLARRHPDNLDLELRVADAHARRARTLSLRVGRADSAISHAEIAQQMVEAIATRDPGNRDRAVDVVTGMASDGQLLAAAGETARAERLLLAAAPHLERWSREDPTDARMVGSLADLYLGLGLVASQRARGLAPGVHRAETWRDAHQWLTRARASFDRDLAVTGSWDLAREQSERIDRAIAGCDSALGRSAIARADSTSNHRTRTKRVVAAPVAVRARAK